MAKSLSSVQRTLRELRNQGRIAAVVERWNQHAGPHGIRQDLFGFIDVIALDPERGIVGVQACTSDFAAHRRKILEDCTEQVEAWLQCGGKVELWGWRKVKVKRGGKAMRWKPRVEDITLEVVQCQ